MSLKKILSTPIPKSEKSKSKIMYVSVDIHSKISLISELLGITKSQTLNNIIIAFIEKNEEEIKDLIILKKNQLDKLF